MIAENPILRGFNPDPSICRKGDDYYLVTSSFEFFPSIPVYHSKDLVNWRQIGSAGDDPELFDLSHCRSSKGVYASTIRYNPSDDLFYIVTTIVHNDDYCMNESFFITASDPAGPWSCKHAVKDAEGIDPSIFFENGRVYYVGNRRISPEIKGKRHIWIAELDIASGALSGKKDILSDGALYNALCPEGPHIYKKDGYYYLLIAEGGSGENHAVTVFRSQDIFGPYEGNPRNPVLTHRMLSRHSEFLCIGHADIIEAPDGSWAAFALGVRAYGEAGIRNLGRETFITPVIWEDGWPVFSPDTGKIEKRYDLPWKSEDPCCRYRSYNGFPLGALFLRAPHGRIPEYRDGVYRLPLLPQSISSDEFCSFVGFRQKEKRYSIETEMEFSTASQYESAGLAVYMTGNAYFLFMRTASGLCISSPSGIIEHKHSELPDRISLRIECLGLDYVCSYKMDGCWIQFGPVLSGRMLSGSLCYTGAVMALYATSSGTESRGYVYFRELTLSSGN